jgi:hypothetical protein
VLLYSLISWWFPIPFLVENLARVEVFGHKERIFPLFCGFKEESFTVLCGAKKINSGADASKMEVDFLLCNKYIFHK